MAVYKRTYEPYAGGLTPAWSRFLIIARCAWAGLRESRILVGLFLISFLPPLVGAVMIYLPHNAGAVKLLELDATRLIAVNGRFFLRFMWWQGTLAWILTSLIGPGLVSPDMRNNALPLYFCRPFSRAEYVLGKMSVLAVLLSLITWIPLLGLWLLEAGLEGWGWAAKNFALAWGMFLGSWIWMLTLCLLALAMSALVRWRVMAGALLFGIFFVAAGLAAAFNEVLHTSSGHILNLVYVIETVWTNLLGVPSPRAVSVGSAWAVLVAACALCLCLLARKVKAYEVVR